MARRATKSQVSGQLQAKVYSILADCIERGVDFGWNRAHKHTDKPDPEAILENIEREVMNCICEYFDFPE